MAESNGPVAAIYAEALYDAAEREGVLPQVTEELLQLNEVLDRMPQALRFFESPVLPFAAKRRVVEAALGGCSRIARNFLLVVIERGRGGLLGQIVAEFDAHTSRKAGIAPVEVRAARPLDDAERRRLTALLEPKLKRKIALHEQVRPELLGGLVLTYGDRVWDASLARALAEAVSLMAAAPPARALRYDNGS
jgi:F-type H+-transporting ATPase subunit delta